jgi:hypothetical protein
MTAKQLKGNGRENHELICRSESGDRSGDELRRADDGRHGRPGVANAAPLRNPFSVLDLPDIGNITVDRLATAGDDSGAQAGLVVTRQLAAFVNCLRSPEEAELSSNPELGR